MTGIRTGTRSSSVLIGPFRTVDGSEFPRPTTGEMYKTL